MFTGLVEAFGTLKARNHRGAGARLTIGTDLAPLVLGESIAVMGVCLTVDSLVSGGFEADASSETLARTTLGQLSLGQRVHLERAVAVGGRFGGHIVSGHVDARTRLLERRELGQSTELSFSLEGALRGLVALKGSVCVDGVSLTVSRVTQDRFSVVLIPHTREATWTGSMPVGVEANLEVDVLARYVARWLEAGRSDSAQDAASSDEALLARLRESGFL